MRTEPRGTRFLHVVVILLAFAWLTVNHRYPPRAQAQSQPPTPNELERHLDSSDSDIRKMRETVDQDHTDLAVLKGNTSLLETIGGAILVAALGNFAISWKGKRP